MILMRTSESRQVGHGKVLLQRRGQKRRAAAVAEFALLAPFLVFLILGMFEMARGIMVKQMLNDAARKSCRTGIKAGKTNADINNEVWNIMTDNGIPQADATITILISGVAADVSTAKPGIDSVSVRIGIPITDVYWISTFFLSASTVDSDYVVMLKQA